MVGIYQYYQPTISGFVIVQIENLVISFTR